MSLRQQAADLGRFRGLAAVDYSNSGVMTFVVNQTGKVYQKDIGEFTGIDAYDPDDTWTKVEEEEVATTVPPE